jgi:hypothetical protein
MKKQIQFGVFRIYSGAQSSFNAETREQIEGPLNNGWSLDSWKVIDRSLDEAQNPVVNIAICLTREVNLEENSSDVKAAVGRPKKDA